MSRNVQAVLAGILLLVFVLQALARRFPNVDWLSWFRMDRPYNPERDRKLDTAWMSQPGIAPKRNPFQRAAEEVREEFKAFHAAMPQLPPEQRNQQRRRSNIFGGIQLILLGIILPFGFYIFKMMLFFSSVSRTENIVLFTASGVCIILGIVAIARSARD